MEIRFFLSTYTRVNIYDKNYAPVLIFACVVNVMLCHGVFSPAAPASLWRSCCWRKSGRASAASSRCWTGMSDRTASSSWWRDPRTSRTSLTLSRRKVPYRRSWPGAFSARCWRPWGTATTAAWCTGTLKTRTYSSISAPERWSSSTSDPEPCWRTPFTQTLMVSRLAQNFALFSF